MSRRIDRRLFLASTLSGAVLTWTGIPSGLFGSEEGEKSQAPWPWIVKELVGQIPIGPNNLRNSEGDFIRLKNGDILYIYTHYYGKGGDDNDTAYLASRRSTDDGKSWTTEDKIEVSDDEAKLNVMSVTCRRLQSGEIALFYLVKDSSVDCRPYMRLSTDEGETWGERVLCVADPSYNVVNNDRIIQLEKSGRIVIPVGRHPVNGAGNLEWKADVFCLYSDDNGKTWNRGETVANPRSVLYQEPGVCELGMEGF